MATGKSVDFSASIKGLFSDDKLQQFAQTAMKEFDKMRSSNGGQAGSAGSAGSGDGGGMFVVNNNIVNVNNSGSQGADLSDSTSELAAAASALRSTMDRLMEQTSGDIDKTQQYDQWMAQVRSLEKGNDDYYDRLRGRATGHSDAEALANLLDAASVSGGVSRAVRDMIQLAEMTAAGEKVDTSAEFKRRAGELEQIADLYDKGRYNKDVQTNTDALMKLARGHQFISEREMKRIADSVSDDEMEKRFPTQPAAPVRTRERNDAERERHKEQQAAQNQPAKDTVIEPKGDVTVNAKKAPAITGGDGGTGGQPQREAAKANDAIERAAKDLAELSGPPGSSQSGKAPKKDPVQQAYEETRRAIDEMRENNGQPPLEGGRGRGRGGGGTPPTTPPGGPNGPGGDKPNLPKSEIRHFSSTDELKKFLTSQEVNLPTIADSIEKTLGELHSSASDISAIYSNGGTLTGISLNARHVDFGNIKTAQLRYAIGAKKDEDSDEENPTYHYKPAGELIRTTASPERLKKLTDKLTDDTRATQDKFNAWMENGALQSTDAQGHNNKRDQLISALGEQINEQGDRRYGRVDEQGKVHLGRWNAEGKWEHLNPTELSTVQQGLKMFGENMSTLNRTMRQDFAQNGLDNIDQKFGKLSTERGILQAQMKALGIDENTRVGGGEQTFRDLFTAMQTAEEGFRGSAGNVDAQVKSYNELHDAITRTKEAIKSERAERSANTAVARREVQEQARLDKANAALNKENAEKQADQVEALRKSMTAFNEATTPEGKIKALADVAKKTTELTQATQTYNAQQQRVADMDVKLANMRERLKEAGAPLEGKPLAHMQAAMDAVAKFKGATDAETRRQLASDASLNFKQAQAEVGRAIRVQTAFRKQDDAIRTTKDETQKLLSEATRAFGGDNEAVRALTMARTRLNLTGGTAKNAYNVRQTNLEKLNSAAEPVAEMMQKFKTDAAAAEKQYEQLKKKDAFKGLSAKEQKALTSAYDAFTTGDKAGTRSALDDLRTQLKTTQALADKAVADAKQGALQDKINQKQQNLEQYKQRAGGTEKWTEEQRNALKATEGFMQQAQEHLTAGDISGARTLFGRAGTQMNGLNQSLKESEKSIASVQKAEEERREEERKAEEAQARAQQKDSQRMSEALNNDIGKAQEQYAALTQSAVFEKLPENMRTGLQQAMERLDTTWSDEALGNMRGKLAEAQKAGELMDRYAKFTESDAFKGLSEKQRSGIEQAFAQYQQDQNGQTFGRLLGKLIGGENAAKDQKFANTEIGRQLALQEANRKLEEFNQKAQGKTLTQAQQDMRTQAGQFLQEAQDAFNAKNFTGATTALQHFNAEMGTLTRSFNASERAAKAASAEQKKEKAETDKKDTAIAKAEGMLTDPRLAAGNQNAVALQQALEKVQNAPKADLPKAMQELTAAMVPVRDDLKAFDSSAKSTEKAYNKLVYGTGPRHEMFKGLTAEDQMRVGDAFAAFQGNRTAANLEALQNAMRTANDLIDLHGVANKSAATSQNVLKAQEQLTAVRQRAGGPAKWTTDQQTMLQQAQGFFDAAKAAANIGNYEQATRSLSSFTTAMGRLGTSLKENEQIIRMDEADKKKQQQEQKRETARQEKEQVRQAARTETAQTKAERNEYYGAIADQAKTRMEEAAAVYKGTGDAKDLAKYQKEVANVQWAEKVAEMKDYARAMEQLRNPTGELGRDDSTQWANAQQAQMQNLINLQQQFQDIRHNGRNQTQADTVLGQMQSEYAALQRSLQTTSKLEQEIQKTMGDKNYGRVDESLKTGLSDAITALNSAAPEQFAEKLNGVREALTNVRTAMTEISTQDYWAEQDKSLASYQQKLEAMQHRNGGIGKWTDAQQIAMATAQTQLAQAQAAAQTGDRGAYEAAFKDAQQQINLLGQSLRDTGALTSNIRQPVDGLTKAFMNIATPMMLWRRFTGVMKKAASHVSAIDSAMVDLKKVTNNTDAEYNQFLTSTGQNAVAIGSSITDLVNTTSTFAHMGYNLTDSQALGLTATKFANVGGFKNTTDAADTMIAAIKGFSDLEIGDADLVGDKLTAVANSYAVTVSDISDGLTKSASSLNVAGNNIDQSTAMITAIAEVTRDAGAAGSALKVLSMRLRGAKSE